MLPSRYASLPSANPPRILEGGDSASANVFVARNKVIGIGISAIHDSVLRAGAKMPGEFLLFFI